MTRGVRLTLLAAASVVALFTSACGGGDDSEDPDAQPTDDVTQFGEGQLDGVPLIAGSQQIGSTAVRDDGTVAATYTVERLTAAQAVERMAELLPSGGWDEVVAPIEEPAGAFRTEWIKGDRRLEVVAIDLDQGEIQMQYSVVLLPTEAEEPVYTSSSTTQTES